MEAIIMAATEMAMHKDTRASQPRGLTHKHRPP